jgi:FkbM family methyltransferase
MIDLNNQYSVSAEAKKLISIFISDDKDYKRYLMGRNEHSALLSKTFKIDGFVDDFTDDDFKWHNLPVLKCNSLPANAIVINCVFSIGPVTAHRSLENSGLKSIIKYSDLMSEFKEKVPTPRFIEETSKDIDTNINKWNNLYNNLYDDQSRKILIDILKYRSTGNYFYMDSYKIRLKEQYFEEFLNFKDNPVFVDAGGYDGDTTEEFCKRYPNYQKILFFEPSKLNLKKALDRLKGYNSIEFFEEGVSDTESVLSFNSELGSASTISEIGKEKIKCTTIDNRVSEKIDFIKMDLEGWELNALKGAFKHISNDFPNLAIAVYHHPSDFWKTFDFIMNLRNDYKIFLRHYTEGWSETIMYFIPDNN